MLKLHDYIGLLSMHTACMRVVDVFRLHACCWCFPLVCVLLMHTACMRAVDAYCLYACHIYWTAVDAYRLYA